MDFTTITTTTTAAAGSKVVSILNIKRSLRMFPDLHSKHDVYT